MTAPAGLMADVLGVKITEHIKTKRHELQQTKN